MVSVIVLAGQVGATVAGGGPADTDLTPFASGPIARLIGARSIGGTHRHVLLVEATNPATAAGSLGLAVRADGLLFAETPTAVTMPTAIQLTAGHVYAARLIDNNGLLNAGATAAAGHAVLSGRLAVNLGDALANTDLMHLTVLYQKEAGGIF